MKKTLSAALLALGLLTGCASSEVSSENSAPAAAIGTQTVNTSEQTTTFSADATAPENESAPEQESSLDISGVWQTFSESGSNGCYYLFNADHTGSSLSMAYGMGVPLRWEVADGKGTFHMGAEDIVEYADVTLDGDTLTLSWEESEPQTLSKVADSAEDFTFFSNEELAQMALNFYTEQKGYTPTICDTQSNPDGTVTIHLYDIVDDHTATLAWYTISRFTAEGTDDIMSEPVSFAGVSSEPVAAG